MDAVIATSALLNGIGILGIRRGHCKSARHKNKHRDSSSSLDENMTVIYNVQNSNQEDISFHSNLNEVRPMTPLQDSQSSQNFVPVEGDEMKITGLMENDSHVGVLTNLSVDHDVVEKKHQDKMDSTDKLGYAKHDVNVTYWLWIGPDPGTAEKHNMTLRIETNATFYAVMQKAASLNHKFV